MASLAISGDILHDFGWMIVEILPIVIQGITIETNRFLFAFKTGNFITLPVTLSLD